MRKQSRAVHEPSVIRIQRHVALVASVKENAAIDRVIVAVIGEEPLAPSQGAGRR
jgi:hypothetical protein